MQLHSRRETRQRDSSRYRPPRHLGDRHYPVEGDLFRLPSLQANIDQGTELPQEANLN